jgi:hypothetical protein
MKRILCFLLISPLLFSCQEKEDVEPELANVVFWTKRSDIYYKSSTDFNIIVIELENFSTSRFIFFSRTTAPDCIEDEDATFYFFRPGSYNMTAEDSKGRTWKSTVTVQSGCNRVELK